MAVDTLLKNQYSDNIMLLAQQLLVKLASTVYIKPDCAGEVVYQEQLASSDAEEKTSRNQAVQNTDPNYDRRKIVPRYFYKAPLVDKMDKIMMLKDPTNEIVRNNAGALARAKDTVIATAAVGTSYSGEAGGTSNTLSGDNVIATGSVGMTIAKIRTAKKVLDASEVDAEDRHLAVSAEQIEDLLAQTEVTSADYAQVKALVSGQPGTLCGFNIVQCEKVTTSSTTRKCFAYHRTGICLGVWLDFLASIDIMPGLHFSAQVYAGQSYGATRLEEKKVVEVDCYEA